MMYLYEYSFLLTTKMTKNIWVGLSVCYHSSSPSTFSSIHLCQSINLFIVLPGKDEMPILQKGLKWISRLLLLNNFLTI